MTRAFAKNMGSWLVLGLLAACGTITPPVITTTNNSNLADVVRQSEPVWPVQGDGVGRVGQNGGPPIADRGIGGTGAPVGTPAAIQTADRGIGGTGIVGVVTGFGSVFVNGVEIQYDDQAPVDVDGTTTTVAALRAGQLVAIRAEGPATEPRATAISVRSAVTGRIEALELGSGTLTIGGQAVVVPNGTWGANRFGLGDWVRVSGLLRSDGTIVASRLDSAPAGGLLVRGRAVSDGQVTRVGKLVLPAPVAAGVKDGQFVIVSGDYVAGHGHVSAVVPDTLFPNPADYFGASTTHLIVQAFVQVNRGAVAMNGLTLAAAPVVSGEVRHDGIAVVSLERAPDGSYKVIGLRYAGYRGDADQSARPGPSAKVGGAWQTARRSGPAATASSTPADNDDAGSATNGRVASVTAGSDSLTGSSTTAPSIASVETPEALEPNTIVPNPIVTPSAPDEPAAPASKEATSTEAAQPTATGTSSSETSTSITPAPVPVTPAPTPAPETTPPPTGVPTVSVPGGISSPTTPARDPTTPVSQKDRDRTGAAWALAKAHRSGDRHAGHLSSGATLQGLTSGPTLNQVTGAVTSLTGLTDSGTAPPRTWVSSSSRNKGETTIGTGSAKARVRGQSGQHGH